MASNDQEIFKEDKKVPNEIKRKLKVVRRRANKSKSGKIVGNCQERSKLF